MADPITRGWVGLVAAAKVGIDRNTGIALSIKGPEQAGGGKPGAATQRMSSQAGAGEGCQRFLCCCADGVIGKEIRQLAGKITHIHKGGGGRGAIDAITTQGLILTGLMIGR